ncbi:helix-turn-helix domain-containing protein [Frankia sp. CNm7]|uniref:Helix-turn-helix domain-containing protein n=1 Tax=Frankia nepalensis TaxID=1836974 RepID=A0A937RFE6_9ACTN|nr:helix-turn-helix domain-containing protein [Frankia nepalensis]MBL7495685.1 helix-turn-helix domain-containing protein [Frankia nepalensis]MBL7510249.1 helix-turn-helix domain-containing protein [Frankia nepalensis]MBL7518463.1 helix-turn-helix domain-containing protein [Frankia nepalensis]MBL7631158.1 helix-turn-helix domain-containing protein [Frankia nepalensis]
MSSRPSPQTDRVVAVVEMLAGTPGGLGQSEIARRLGTTPATCYPTLAALERAGWLRRHPTRRTYALGPGLIAAGQAAAAGTDALAAGRSRMADLHRRLALSVVALVPAGEFATVAHLVVDPRGRPVTTLRVGDKIPFHPPLGITFMAWQPDEVIEGWLDRGGVLVEADRREYREILPAVRARGYSVELSASLDERVRRRVGEAAAANLRDQLPGLLRDLAAGLAGPADFVAGALADEVSYRVDSLSAPVFDAHGDVALVVSLRGFAAPATGGEVARVGAALTAATDSITADVSGRPPTDRHGGHAARMI